MSVLVHPLVGVRTVRFSAPLGHAYRRRHRTQRAKRRRAHSSEAQGANFEVVSGVAQFKLRMPEAVLH
eukprot:9900657-Alexandrium_andersonii.AAC.1